MSPRALVVDVGNSRIKFGLLAFSAPVAGEQPECFFDLFTGLEEPIPFEIIHDWIRSSSEPVLRTLIGGSNPPMISQVIEQCRIENLPEVYQVTRELPLEIKTDHPEKVGLDRLLNALAVNAIREPDQPAIIVSCGTACTVDYVDESGCFQGGSILPGFEMAAKSLNRYTALLPEIPVEELQQAPKQALGKNTRAALQSGLFWGLVGGIREMTGLLSKLSDQPAQLYLTGGGSHVLAPCFPKGEWMPHLNLQGIVLAAHEQMG